METYKVSDIVDISYAWPDIELENIHRIAKRLPVKGVYNISTGGNCELIWLHLENNSIVSFSNISEEILVVNNKPNIDKAYHEFWDNEWHDYIENNDMVVTAGYSFEETDKAICEIKKQLSFKERFAMAGINFIKKDDRKYFLEYSGKTVRIEREDPIKFCMENFGLEI